MTIPTPHFGEISENSDIHVSIMEEEDNPRRKVHKLDPPAGTGGKSRRKQPKIATAAVDGAVDGQPPGAVRSSFNPEDLANTLAAAIAEV